MIRRLVAAGTMDPNEATARLLTLDATLRRARGTATDVAVASRPWHD